MMLCSYYELVNYLYQAIKSNILTWESTGTDPLETASSGRSTHCTFFALLCCLQPAYWSSNNNRYHVMKYVLFLFFKLRIDSGEKAGKLSVRERGRKRSSNWPRGGPEPLQYPYCSTRWAIPAPLTDVVTEKSGEKRFSAYQNKSIRNQFSWEIQSPVNNELIMMCRATLWLL